METIDLSPIEQIHENVFSFLLDKHFTEKRQGRQFFFRLRQRFPEGKERFWFLGNNDYIAISFWTGNDSINKSPNIYFEIRMDGHIHLYLAARSDVQKSIIFQGLASEIGDVQPTDTGGLWRKTYANNHEGGYLIFLESFLNGDKKTIDDYLDSHRLEFNTMKLSNPDFVLEDEEYGEPFTRQFSSEEFGKLLVSTLQRRNKTENSRFNSGLNSDMPVCFKGIEVRNFQGIERLQVTGIPIDSKWIVLTGENGFGKSSVLQSIAIGLYGVADGPYKLLDETGFIALEGRSKQDNFINLSISSQGKSTGTFNSIGKRLAVYGASRLNMASDNYRPDAGNVTYNLFFPDGNLINIEIELVESKAYNENKFNLLKNAFLQLIPDLHDIIIEPDPKTKKPIVKYIEHDINKQPYQHVTFNQLASGFRNIIAMVGDIVSRFSVEQFEYKSLGDLEGIVIIDEIELHLHPKYQKLLPRKLSEIFPKIQFIVSTHSPIPLLGMPFETTLLKVERTKITGISLERLDVDISNLLPNTILTSPVFGFQDIIPDSHSADDFIRVEKTFTEIEENDRRRADISKFLSDERKEELLKLLKGKK